MRRLIAKDGIHQGFDLMAWSVVGLQIFGGLIVGMVVKYADNILKNFANALSVIFTVLGAMPLFGQYPSPGSSWASPSCPSRSSCTASLHPRYCPGPRPRKL